MQREPTEGTTCPHCGGVQSTVADSRPGAIGKTYPMTKTRRRRECGACQKRYTTYELTGHSVDKIIDEAKKDAVLTTVTSVVGQVSVPDIIAALMKHSAEQTRLREKRREDRKAERARAKERKDE